MGTSASFETHPLRGRFNAAFFAVLDGYINWLVRDKKCKVFSELPREVVEIGPGVGANFAYMPPGCRVIAIEPNPWRPRAASFAGSHGVRWPWTWAFEGYSCERDLAAVIHAAGFASVEIDQYRICSPFLPVNTQIAGTAVA